MGTFASAPERAKTMSSCQTFPAVRAMLDADFPSGDEISSNFAAAGFTPRHHEIVTEIVAPDWPSFVRKSALRADSSWRVCLTRSSIRAWLRFALIVPISTRLRL
jgi:hypothetical protein